MFYVTKKVIIHLILDTKLRRHKTPTKSALPIREKVYQHLKSAVLAGDFDPGEKLTEENLAKELKVSRTPVREALHKLESEGLIKPRKKRGFIASRDSKEEVEELLELRAVLEGFTLRLISERISEEKLEELHGLIEKAEEALRRNRIDEVFRWNTRFHDRLHELVWDRPRLHDLIVNMRKYVLRYRKDTLQYPDGGKRAIEGHRKILLALKLRDSELCERIMRDHIREAKEDALQTLFGRIQE